LACTTRSLAFADQGIVSAGNFAAGIVMARTFGAYEFGWFTLVWVLVEFMSSMQFAAVLQPMLNVGPKEDPCGANAYYTAVGVQQLIVAIILSAIVFGSASIAAQFLSNGPTDHIALPLAAATLAYQAQNFFRRYHFARGRPTAAAGNDALRFGCQLIGLLALSQLSAKPTAEAGIWILAGACCVSSLYGAASFGTVEWNRSTFERVLKRHWSFSKWLLPSAAMYWMTSQAFVLMSGAVLGPATTGMLKAAMSISGVLNIMLQALDSFAPAQAAQAMHSGGPARLLGYMGKLAVLTIVGMILAAALLSVDPNRLLHMIYGSDYVGGGYLVRWSCVVSIIYSITLLLGIWAAAIERTSFIFRSYVVAGLFTLVACYPLTLYGGLYGVVIGAVLVEAIKAVVLGRRFLRWRG
jgi:O-antigen/teichoic acid export membrane protein